MGVWISLREIRVLIYLAMLIKTLKLRIYLKMFGNLMYIVKTL